MAPLNTVTVFNTNMLGDDLRPEMSKRLIKSQVLYELFILFDFQTGIPIYKNLQIF